MVDRAHPKWCQAPLRKRHAETGRTRNGARHRYGAAFHGLPSAYQVKPSCSRSRRKPARSSARRDGTLSASTSRATTRRTSGRARSACASAGTNSDASPRPRAGSASAVADLDVVVLVGRPVRARVADDDAVLEDQPRLGAVLRDHPERIERVGVRPALAALQPVRRTVDDRPRRLLRQRLEHEALRDDPPPHVQDRATARPGRRPVPGTVTGA